MEYNFRDVEKKWQAYWAKNHTFRADNNSDKQKYYVLDMFPYPSGAGLHVGHPLGYIASDIIARYKRLKGFNVLHPMGYDSFGLPAEQYAIQTGQHPKITTEQNIARYREQLDKIGFSFDWEREVKTSDPNYYKWTQWIFIQLFKSWYNRSSDKAENISTLISLFETNGNANVNACCDEGVKQFTAAEWKGFSEKEKSDILMAYRITYLGEAYVNWCPALGTVLANDEVKDGVSERGGHPVERKLMKQWSMRITAYAERLLNDLDTIDWTESIKEAQRNWIGKSEGTSLKFQIENSDAQVEVFTTRPDTIFGVSFVTLAPEHELVNELTTIAQKAAVDEYVTIAKNRSERERQADVKKISGVFTGAYVIHPFTGKQVPVWVGDYVLAGYGTGAVMAVPGHDSRDYAFAKHFELPIIEVVSGGDLSTASYDAKEGKLVNSDFLNGLEVKEAIKKAIEKIEEKGIGKGKVNYRLRDAVFGRQRYWGEPIPIYYKNDIPYALDESELPLVLPEVDKYLPTETGEPPLARAKGWGYKPQSTGSNLSGFKNLTGLESDGAFDYELSTMPGWAGSSWYYLRYMDVNNNNEFASKKAIDYWSRGNFGIDLYIGGSEHATGHLLYVRFWTKFLNDLGLVPFVEPAKKLINQGMIQGVSEKIYRRNGFSSRLYNGIFLTDKDYDVMCIPFPEGINGPIFYSAKNVDSALKYLNLKSVDELEDKVKFEVQFRDNVSINFVKNNKLNLDEFVKQRPEYQTAIFVCSGGVWVAGEFYPHKYLLRDENIPQDEDSRIFYTFSEVEKMSKSKWNVVNPDDIIGQYGADALRLYEMFLGPLELSKPWNTNGITGVSNFMRKLWRLYHDGERVNISEEKATKPELKALHKAIKKIVYDIEHFSFNTSVSNFMICVNELTDLKCNKREILEPLAIIIAPYAPHIAEELWNKLGHEQSITYAKFPEVNESYLVETSFNYPISLNGKTKFNYEFELSLTKEELEKEVMNLEQTQKILEGKTPKKVIVVHQKIINMVV